MISFRRGDLISTSGPLGLHSGRSSLSGSDSLSVLLLSLSARSLRLHLSLSLCNSLSVSLGSIAVLVVTVFPSHCRVPPTPMTPLRRATPQRTRTTPLHRPVASPVFAPQRSATDKQYHPLATVLPQHNRSKLGDDRYSLGTIVRKFKDVKKFSCCMETWCCVQLRIYLFAGISLMLFLCTGSCVHGSSLSSEAQSCNPDFSSNNSAISSFCSCKRFIMESYHGKYGSFLDSDFQDFIAQGLPSGLCGMLPDDLPRLSVLQRNLIGEGSHRLLSSSIRLNVEPKSITKLPTHSCEVIIIERLPTGVFADPFELQHLLQRGVFNNIAVFGDTNLELPSFLSNRSVVEVHMDVGPNLLTSQKNGPDINIALPLHARYPPLDASGYSRVKFGAPDVFVHCSIEGNSPNQSCLFSPTGDVAEPGSGEIVWRIPAGRKTHAEVVSVVTFISAIVSTLFIVLTSIFYSKGIPYKTLKQS